MPRRDSHSDQDDSQRDIRPDRPSAPSKGESGSKLPSPSGNFADATPANEQETADFKPNEHEIEAIPPQLHQSSRVEEDMATLVLDPVNSTGQTPIASEATHSDKGRSVELDGDSVVMLRVRDGDDAAFNMLVEKYHRPIIHYMYRMIHNQAVAEELAQEVFLRVYRSRESYRAEARFSTWLYRIATNLGVNHARDTRHERTAHTVYLDEQDPETGTSPDVADSRPSAEQDLVRDERMQAIRKHVMALPERQRSAVLMHKYQGMDYRQIGEVLKLSESATKSLLFRAYQTLRVRLQEFVEEN